MFNGVDPQETLALARLACDVGADAPHADVHESIVSLLDARASYDGHGDGRPGRFAPGDVVANPHFSRGREKVFFLLGTFPGHGKTYLEKRLADLGAVVSPTLDSSSSTRRPDWGVTSEGFNTTALPAIKPWMVGLSDRMNGKFQGVMIPTTPSGRYEIFSFLVFIRCRGSE